MSLKNSMFSLHIQFTTLNMWDIFYISLVILHAKRDCKSQSTHKGSANWKNWIYTNPPPPPPPKKKQTNIWNCKDCIIKTAIQIILNWIEVMFIFLFLSW